LNNDESGIRGIIRDDDNVETGGMIHATAKKSIGQLMKAIWEQPSSVWSSGMLRGENLQID
jgi:hypothetical protein